MTGTDLLLVWCVGVLVQFVRLVEAPPSAPKGLWAEVAKPWLSVVFWPVFVACSLAWGWRHDRS